MTKVSVKRHLKEIQWRLMLVAVFFIAGATLAYQYQEFLLPLLLNPLNGQKLVYLNPAGGFSFIFLVSIYAGIALSFPVLLQQLYAFLRPVLPKSVQKKSLIIIISSFFLMLCGIAFGYFIAVPNALSFLYGFAESYIEASLTAESYLNFIVGYTIGIGIVFQLPLLLMLRHGVSPLTPGGLMKSEKWVFLGSFIVAAIITPTPDPVNQTIMAAPVILIYQIGVIGVLFSIARARVRAKKANRHAPISDEQYQNLIALPEVDDMPLTLVPIASNLQPALAVQAQQPVEPAIQPLTSATPTLFAAEPTPPQKPAMDINSALAAELNGTFDTQLETQFETELEAALKAEAAPDPAPEPKQIVHHTTASHSPHPIPNAATVQPTAQRPLNAPSMNRPAFRSMDGIVRQRVIKPQVPAQ